MKTQKIGITFSSFDLLHAGHIKMLEEAKTVCDYLIVGLQLDPAYDRPTKNKPTQTVVERYIQLKAVNAVDEIVPYYTEQDLEDILRSFVIDVRIIGDEYKDKDFTENIIYEKLLNDKLGTNLGYLYENVVAQLLTCNGNELFYYTFFNESSRHNYEIDFLIAKKNKVCPIEVKSSGYKTHKSLDEFSIKFSSFLVTIDIGKFTYSFEKIAYSFLCGVSPAL